MRLFKTWVLILLFFSTSQNAVADIANMYGFGSVSAGLAGSDRAWSSDGYTVCKNPALMSFSEQTLLSMGFFGTYDQFNKLSNVVVDKPEVGGTAVRRGDVDTDVPDAFNFLLGSVWSLSDRPSHPRLGIAMSVPVLRLMEPATKDIFQPQYAMYLSDVQRLTLNIGGSIKVGERVSLGAGAHYYLAQGATVSGRMPVGSDKVSTMNMKMDVRPVIAPTGGIAYQLQEEHLLSLYYSAVRDARLSMTTNEEIGFGTATVPLVFNGTATLWYDPEVYSVGYSGKFDRTRLFASVDYEKWSSFDGAIMKLDFGQFGGTWFQNRPDTRFRDIWVPRLGASWDSDPWVLRAGYSWRPSATPDLDGQTNFLDANRHVVAVGFSRILLNFLGVFDKPVRLDSHIQAHVFVPRHIDKQDPNSIGGPGYDVRGTMWSYSLALTLGL